MLGEHVACDFFLIDMNLKIHSKDLNIVSVHSDHFLHRLILRLFGLETFKVTLSPHQISTLLQTRSHGKWNSQRSDGSLIRLRSMSLTGSSLRSNRRPAQTPLAPTGRGRRSVDFLDSAGA